MTKSLKKIAAFLSMFAMAFVLFLPMQAKADEERTALFVQVPDDWENPCVWAWDEDGNNAFDAWPGGEAEADTANEGWYYIYIPAWANHVIVNANEGNVQTGEILLEGGNAWITVEDADNASVSYEALTQGDIPEYVEKFIIHASVPESWESPCLWAWSAPDGTNAFASWPGEPFAEGEDGWLTLTVPGWINSIIVNGNEGSVQTSDISVETGKDIWLVVTGAEEYELSYEKPDGVTGPADTAPADTPDADSDGGQDAGTDPDNSADQTPDADTDATDNVGAGQSTDPADSDSSKTGLSGGLIALIVAACAVVLAVIAGVVVKLKKKGNKS